MTPSSVPAGTAVVTEVGSHSVVVDLGPDFPIRYGDRLRLLDTTGEDLGWVRLTEEAENPHLGGPGQATIVSGAAVVGQHLEKIPLARFALEAYAGSGSDFNTWDYGESSKYSGDPSKISSVADFAAKIWYRTGTFSDGWIGLGARWGIEKITKERASWSYSSFGHQYDNVSYTATSSSEELEFGFDVGLRKGYTIHRRIGWFLQLDGATYPSSTVARFQVAVALGLNVDLAPGLSLQSRSGVDWWMFNPDLSASTVRFASGLSLVWIPSRR